MRTAHINTVKTAGNTSKIKSSTMKSMMAPAIGAFPLAAGSTDAVAVLRSMTLRSNGFGIEPELTAKIFKRGYRVYEVPITYEGRGYDQGKKITWAAGFVALWVLLKYRFVE